MRVIHAVALGLALTACQPAPARFSTQDDLDIRAVYRAFAAAAAAGDVEAMAGLYAGEMAPRNLAATRASSAIRERWTGLTAHANAQLTFHVTWVAGEGSLAYAVGGYHLVTTMKDSTQAAPPAVDGNFVSVFGRQADGSWKIIADNWNMNAPAAVPAPAPPPARRR